MLLEHLVSISCLPIVFEQSLLHGDEEDFAIQVGQDDVAAIRLHVTHILTLICLLSLDDRCAIHLLFDRPEHDWIMQLWQRVKRRIIAFAGEDRVDD